MDPVSEEQTDKNQLLHQQQLQKQHQQQQQLLKQQLQQQSNRQLFQQQQSQQTQSQSQQQQQLSQITPQLRQQQQLPQVAPQFRQQKQQQPLRNSQGILQQQILQQEHLKQQKILLDSQKKQEQTLLELLQLQDTNGDEDGSQEDRLIAQQQRPQLIQQQQQLHLQQQQRQQQEHQQELHLLQQKQLQQPQHLLQQTSQLIEQSQLAQQTQQQQSPEVQPQFVQQPHIVKQPQVIHKQQLVQQSQIIHQPQIAQNSQTLNQSQIIQQPQLLQQPQLVQQPKIIQSQQLVTMSTQQQTKIHPPHSQQLLQQQLQQLLSKNKNYPQRIVVLGNQPQQQQLVTQQPQRVLSANTSVQQQILPQQMQCVVVTGAGQPQSQQMQRVVVAATGQQKQQPQQMQRVVVTSTSGQKQQQFSQQQLQQIQHVVIPNASQQQSLQLQNVINPCSVQQQTQQMQRVVVAATGQTQPQLQQTQRVIVTSTSGQQPQQLVQSLQPVAQRIVIGQLKTSPQTQQIQSPSQRNVVLGHVQQQVIQRPSSNKQQQQRVLITGQQQILKLPPQQQSMQQLLKLPQAQQTSQQLLKLPQEMLHQPQQLSQQLSQPKLQQNDIHDSVQQPQHNQVTQQPTNLKPSDQNLVQQLHVKQSHQQLQQLHIQPSQKQLHQQHKPLKQSKQEQQKEQPHLSSSVIIGQRQQSARPESDDLQQKQPKQLHRKNLQDRLLLQQRQQKEQQKYLQEQQSQQKQQQLREHVLLQQHLKQQNSLVFKQQPSSENRVSYVTGINQDQKQQDDQVQKSLQGIAKTANADQFSLGELISLSSSSDEDDDDDVVRDQRNFLREAKSQVCEHFNAISEVLEPRYQIYYVDLLKNYLNGQLSRDELDLKFHKMINVLATSMESSDNIFNDGTHAIPAVSSRDSTSTTVFSNDSLVTSIYKTSNNEETIIPNLNTMSESSMPKSEEEMSSLPSIDNSMPHIASSLKKAEDKYKETITKRVQLHSALIESLREYMPFQILRQKRREARTRGFTETGFPLRLFTYMDVPQVRESIMHWYPHVAGSLARWYWPDKIPCETSMVENNIEKQSLKSFRKSELKEAIDAVSAAVLLRPPSFELLPSLFGVTTNTEIAQAIQLHNFKTKEPPKLEIESLKSSRRKQFEQMAQKIRLRDWLTNWLRQLKVQGQELEYREHLLTENLRQLQVRILNKRSKVLIKFKARQQELQDRVRRYCDRSSIERAKCPDDEIDKDFEDIEDDQNCTSKNHKNKGRIRQTKIANSFPKKTTRNQRRKTMFSMITLLQDRLEFQSNLQILQEIRQECLQIRKVYDHVREIRKKYCPCCDFDARPCQYRKLMRKFRQNLRVYESNVIENEIESNLENLATVTEKMDSGIKKPEILLVEKEIANAEKIKINATTLTESLNTIYEDIQQNDINDAINTISTRENTTNNASTSTTNTVSISNVTTDSITKIVTDSFLTTSESTVMTTASQTSDIICSVVDVEKHDVGVNCELVRGGTLQTHREVGGSSIQQRPSSSLAPCSIVNVADYAARAAEAALAASRRSYRRPSKLMPVVAVNETKDLVDSDKNNVDDDNDNCNQQASKLMPPPPPVLPTPPSQLKISTSRKPTTGARYLQQQQLLLDRHKQLERMRLEEKEKQQKAQNEHLRQLRKYSSKEKGKRNMVMETDDFSTEPMQSIGSGLKQLPTTSSQNMYPESNDEILEELNSRSHSKDNDAEKLQQSNYYFYRGDYYSSDDEMSGSSSIEPSFPPLLHDLRIDQLPRPSSRVPAAAVLPPGVRRRQSQIPQSVYQNEESSTYNSQFEVEYQEAQSTLPQRMYRESSRRRNVDEHHSQEELLEHGVNPTKSSQSSSVDLQSPSLERENSVLGTHSSSELNNKMQDDLRKRLQFELLEKPLQRQLYQQYKNDNEPVVDDNNTNVTADLHQLQTIPQERSTNEKITKSNSIPLRLSRYKAPEKYSTRVDEKTYQDHVIEKKLELAVQQNNSSKQSAVSLISKKKNKRQSKRIDNRRNVRKRKDKTSVHKDDDSSSSEEEDSEEIVDIDELRMVQWKAPLIQWNKRPISFVENINHEQSIEKNVCVVDQHTEEMEVDIVSEEDTEKSKCNLSPKNKTPRNLWQEVSEIYLDDSEFSEMKRLDLEYRKLLKDLLSDNRIKHIMEIQEHVSENIIENSSSDNTGLPSLLSLTSSGMTVQKQLAIHQIHYWMSEIQRKREEIFYFMKRVQENTKHPNVIPEGQKNKIVVIQRKEKISEVDILQEWHDLFLSKYSEKLDGNTDNVIYNDKCLFLIQDLIDQYYPLRDSKTVNNKWLRVAKINLRDSEFNKMGRLIFEYRKLMKILMSNKLINELMELQQHAIDCENNSTGDEEDPSHLILSLPFNEAQRENLENIRNLMSKIRQKWNEMYQLLEHINNNCRLNVISDKQLVLTQRVEATGEIDDLQLWHDFLLSACDGENRPNDGSEILDHFLLEQLIDRYYPAGYDCDRQQLRMLVTPERQSKVEDVIVLEEDNSDDEEEIVDEKEMLQLEKQISRIEEIRKLDQERAFLEHFKEQCRDTLKNNEGDLKQLSEFRQNQYQRHGLSGTVNHKKGFHDTFILKSVRVTPTHGVFDFKHPLRIQLLNKIVDIKCDQLSSNSENQQQSYRTTCSTKSDDSQSSDLTIHRDCLFCMLKDKNMFRGSAHWWVHFGLERRISPLIMNDSPDIQTRPMVTVPFVNQLQLTIPQTEDTVAKVVVKEQQIITPIVLTYQQESNLWSLINDQFLNSLTEDETRWMEKLQWKFLLFEMEYKQHWKLASQIKQKQVELLQNSVQHALLQHGKENVNEEQNQTQNVQLKKSISNTSVLCVEHGTEVHKKWNQLEIERKFHENRWKEKRFEHFELKKINRLCFRETFSRLANHLHLENNHNQLLFLKKLAFQHFSRNFPPLNDAEREKLVQEMLTPISIEGGSYYEYYQRILNISKENEPKLQDLQPQISVDEQVKMFKLHQLLNLIINQKVPNMQTLLDMQPAVIKQLLQEQTDQHYQQEKNKISLRNEIYKYNQAQSEQESNENEQIKFFRNILVNVVLLHFNQRLILIQQLNRVNERLAEAHNQPQEQTFQALSSSTEQISTTSVILVPQSTISKEQAKSSVILTPHKSSVLKQHTSASLIPHHPSTSIQSSIISVPHQPLSSSNIQSSQSFSIPPTLKMIEETREILEQRLRLVNRRLTPLMKLWEFTLYFPERSLHKELDDIVENRLRDLGVNVWEDLESYSQTLLQISKFDRRIDFTKITTRTKRQLDRMEQIVDYLDWQRHKIRHLIGESVVLMYHERPVISTCQRSLGTQEPKYWMLINLEKGLIRKDSIYSMFMTIQPPLSSLQRFAPPLLHLPNESPSIGEEHTTHSLLLKLREPFTAIQKSFNYSASMIFLQSCISNQIDSTLLKTQPMLTSKQQSSSSSVTLTPQQPSTSKNNFSSSKTIQTLQKEQPSIFPVSPSIMSESIVISRKCKNNQHNRNREKRRLSSGDENENCGKRLKSTFKKKHNTSSLAINRKRRRQISTSCQTKKSTNTVCIDEDSDVVIISDSNDTESSTDSGSESLLETNIQKPATSMTVQMSDKSPLTIKLIRVKPTPPVITTSEFGTKSTEDDSRTCLNNLNYIDIEKKKEESKKNADKKIKKTKQKVVENERLKEKNRHEDNENNEMMTTIERENSNKMFPVIDQRVPETTAYTALINQPSQVSIVVKRPIEDRDAVGDNPTKEIISTKKPIKVALVESRSLLTKAEDEGKIIVRPKGIKPVNMACTINESLRKTCGDHTMGVIKGIVDAAEKTIKKISIPPNQKPQEEGDHSSIQMPTEQCITNSSIENGHIDNDTKHINNITEKVETTDHQLAIPIHKTTIERYRELVRTVTVDYEQPAVPVFYDHGFAEDSPERAVHSRFVSNVKSMMASKSVALRPQLIQPQRLQLLMECASKKLYSNEPLTIGGVDINRYSTLVSLLNQVISQNSTVQTSSTNDNHFDNSCRTSNLMFDTKQVKNRVDSSTYQKPSTSSPSLITRPSRLTTTKTIPIPTSTSTCISDVNQESQTTNQISASIAFMSAPSITMTTSYSPSPTIKSLEKSNSTVITPSNGTSPTTRVTETLSGSNTIKRSASDVSHSSSSTTSNTSMMSPSLLVNLPKRSKSAVMTTASSITIMDTSEFETETVTAPSNNLKQSQSGKRSTTVTAVSSTVDPPKRSKSAVVMTVSPCSTKTVITQTTPIMTPIKMKESDAHNSKNTSVESTTDESSDMSKDEPSIVDVNNVSNTVETEETIITKENMRIVTVKRNVCNYVPAEMDVTADACSLMVAACEQFVRNMVKERLTKCGRGAGTQELRRRKALISAMVVDGDINPVPDYCRTSDLGTPEISPEITDTRTYDNSQAVLDQKKFLNFISVQPIPSDVLTFETIVETQTTTTTTTSISSANKQFPPMTSSTTETISSPLVEDIGSSARTRGRVVSKTTTSSLPSVTVAKTLITENELPIVSNQELGNNTILSSSKQPATAPLTEKQNLGMSSTSEKCIAGSSTIKQSNCIPPLNTNQFMEIPSTSKPSTVVSTSTTVQQLHSTPPLPIVTDAMKNPLNNTTVVVTKTPPISTLKKKADSMVGKSGSSSSAQCGRLAVPPKFHGCQPFGSLVSTSVRAAAETAAKNNNAYMYSSNLDVDSDESDESDEDIDGWSCYLGDHASLPPYSRLVNFPMFGRNTEVPVVSMEKNDTNRGGAHDKNQSTLTRQRLSVSGQVNEKEKEASPQQFKLNSEQQDNQSNQQENPVAKNLNEHQNKVPDTVKKYQEKFFELQYGTERPLLDQSEMLHHQGLVSWY